MRKLFVSTLLTLLILVGCDGYRTPNGGYAIDVQIRIAPPAVIPTVSPSITPLPTATRTLTPTFTATSSKPTSLPPITITWTPTVVAVTSTPLPTWTPEDPTPSQESTVVFITPEAPEEGTVIAYSLNVRRCASVTCLVDYKIYQGETVYITEEVEVDETVRIWLQIDVPGTDIEGWVAAMYIERDHG